MTREVDTAWILELVGLCDEFGWRLNPCIGALSLADIHEGDKHGTLRFTWKHKPHPQDHTDNKLFVIVNHWFPSHLSHLQYDSDAWYCFGYEEACCYPYNSGAIKNNDLGLLIQPLIQFSYAKTNPRWWYDLVQSEEVDSAWSRNTYNRKKTQLRPIPTRH